ncbi:unnamed protein product [Dicrocoelium dendriticum]|nr:unnamed protein product [Dicrocoelium dendriticum]
MLRSFYHKILFFQIMGKKSKKSKNQKKHAPSSVKPIGTNKRRKQKSSKRFRNQLRNTDPLSEKVINTTTGNSIKKKPLKSRRHETNPAKLSAPCKLFGAASSDSEPEPISANWHVGGDDAGTPTGPSEWSHTTASKKTPQSDGEHASSDLENSETDADEELDETELEVLVRGDLEAGQKSKCISRDPKKNVEPTNAPKSGVRNVPSELSNSKNSSQEKLPESKPSSASWRNPMSILCEIERRSVDLSSRTLYIAPVPRDCTHDSLKQLSSTLSSSRLSYNFRTKCCRKYAFLEYPDAESALAARKAILGRLFGNQSLNVQVVPPQFIVRQGSERVVDRTQLFVTGLLPSVTKAELKQLFPKASAIDYPFHPGGYPLGYATVKFVNEDVALEAFTDAHCRKMKGHPVFVNYVIHSNKNEKRTSDVPKSKRPKESDMIRRETPARLPNRESYIPNESGNGAPKVKTEPAMTRPKVIVQTIFDADEDIANTQRSDVQNDDDEFLIKPSGSPTDRKPNILSRLVHAQNHTMSDSAEASSDENDDQSNLSRSSDHESGSEYSSAEEGSEPDESDKSPTDVEKQSGAEDEEKSDSPSSNGSSGEDIDRELKAVMKARRGAMRSLKTAGSAKSQMTGGRKMKPDQVKRVGKPLMLPVPSKRHKV